MYLLFTGGSVSATSAANIFADIQFALADRESVFLSTNISCRCAKICEEGVCEGALDGWIGGVEQGSGLSFMVPVHRRRAIDLLPHISTYIRPGSTIGSDKWRAYRRIRILQHRGLMYRHLTVNHRHHFVDPLTGFHTQLVEKNGDNGNRKCAESKGLATTS